MDSVSEHAWSKEPWWIDEFGYEAFANDGPNPTKVLEVYEGPFPAGEYAPTGGNWAKEGVTQANLARAVACVNTLAGVTKPSKIRGLIRAAKKIAKNPFSNPDANADYMADALRKCGL